MIYLVDEDLNDIEVYRDFFAENDYEVLIIQDADTALGVLRVASDVEGIILDVMLPTASASESEFDAIETRNYTLTGLALANKLKTEDEKLARPGIYKKIVLFSGAIESGFRQKIGLVEKDLGIQFVGKDEYGDPEETGQRLLEIIKSWNS